MSELYKYSNWLNKNIEFLFGASITEYDIKSAGLSIIKKYKLLPRDQIDELDKMDKSARNVKIGLMQRDNKELTKNLLIGFENARKDFININNLDAGNILSIKKDAIFVYNKTCNELCFDEIWFSEKNKYSTFLLFGSLEFYLYPKNNICHIKGLGQGNSLDELMENHKDYIIDFIMTFSRMRERLTDKKQMIYWLSKFIMQYRNRELPSGYYRELNRGNKYRILEDEETLVNNIDDVSKVNILYNYMGYIVPLAGLYV